jgi:2-iminobutanoate/2-iminopropanoate deaminase
MTVVRTNQAPSPGGPYSQGRTGAGLLFVAGQSPHDPASRKVVGTTIQEQTKRTLESLKGVVEAAGASLRDVLKVNVYLTNLDDFAGMNEVYSSFFPEPYPARTTVGVALLGFLVEIDAVVVLPKADGA